jgi:hypothetical protein
MTDRYDEIAGRRAASGSRSGRPSENDAALVDRIHKLRLLLPSFAEEAASARREAARLRFENAELKRRVAELERK